jgi:hypothetical protein
MPIAVGEMLLSKADAVRAGMKGKAMRVAHTYRSARPGPRPGSLAPVCARARAARGGVCGMDARAGAVRRRDETRSVKYIFYRSNCCTHFRVPKIVCASLVQRSMA